MKYPGRIGDTAPTGDEPLAAAHETYEFDDLRIEAGTRRVFRKQVDLGVSGLTFDLFLALLRGSPALKSFDELMALVWPGVIVSPETLTQRVKLLRQALGDSAEQPRYILAVRGHGYRLRGAARRAALTMSDQTTPAAAAQKWSTWGGAAALILLVAGLLSGGWVWMHDRGGSDSATPSLRAEAAEYVRQAHAIVNGSSASFLAAVALYDEALARSPDLVDALSGRAMNRAALVWNGSPLSRGLDLARKDAERALELDPSNADAASALASINSMRGKWALADSQFRAAMAAHPRNAEIRARYALSLLLPTGQLQRAVDEATAAQALATDHGGFTAAMLAFARAAQGADVEAVEFANLMVSHGGDPRQVAHVYIVAAVHGRHYVEAAERAISIMPLEVRSAGGEAALRQAFAALDGNAGRGSALAALRRLAAEPGWDSADTWARWPILFLFAAYGAMDELNDELSRILRKEGDRYPQIIAAGTLWSPEFRAYRQDRRFSSIAERLGLIDFWRETAPPSGCKLGRTGVECSR